MVGGTHEEDLEVSLSGGETHQEDLEVGLLANASLRFADLGGPNAEEFVQAGLLLHMSLGPAILQHQRRLKFRSCHPLMGFKGLGYEVLGKATHVEAWELEKATYLQTMM